MQRRSVESSTLRLDGHFKAVEQLQEQFKPWIVLSGLARSARGRSSAAMDAQRIQIVDLI
jgi:hypothetical protein